MGPSEYFKLIRHRITSLTANRGGGDDVRIERRFTRKGQGRYEGITFSKRSSEIRNPDGSTVFKLENIDAPSQWSQLAVDILAQKYFRKAGVPQVGPDGHSLTELDGRPVLAGEN